MSTPPISIEDIGSLTVQEYTAIGFMAVKLLVFSSALFYSLGVEISAIKKLRRKSN
jgi:hypothetical protein